VSTRLDDLAARTRLLATAESARAMAPAGPGHRLAPELAALAEVLEQCAVDAYHAWSDELAVATEGTVSRG
jgi:hypothetical protein